MEELQLLSQEFKPTNVRFTVDLENQHSIDDINRNAVGIITRAKQFVENGYSCKGLDFQFKNIREH